ncbi:MAG: tripartite tricarboxylate transporter substrate binding protein [Betaproteobacteria bacterium]|nr:tripartite tricarboxylate transporter substrate binding protein [Betaproteobacteria bacterium]
MTRRLSLRVAALALALFTAAAVGQVFPSKPVRIIVPFPPGAVDLMARYLCEKFPQALGQPCLVENKPGAGAIIGIDFVAKAEPDGHTLLLAPNNLSILPSLYAKLPFDAMRDLAPIALVSSTPVMIGAHPSFPPKSFQEFIAYVRDNPGKVNFTSCGLASVQHLAGESLKVLAGLKMTHIPYKGCGPAEVDVLGGQVPVIISNAARFMPQIRAGKLRGYALTGAQRTDLAPGYPTIAELGFPGYEFDVWFGLLAPGRTPKEIIGRLNAEANRVIGLAEVKERLRSQFYEPIGGTPEKFAEVIRADIERYGKVVREAGIKPE